MRRMLVVAAGLIFASTLMVVHAQESPLKGTTEAALMNIEHRWARAYVNGDLPMIERILADDYVASDSEGQVQTKDEILGEFSSGYVKYFAVKNGPMKVFRFGTMAVVVGSDDEKSIRGTMDTSGHYVWTDVFVYRDGGWQPVASQGTFVGPALSD